MQNVALFLYKQVKYTPILLIHFHKLRTIYACKSVFGGITVPQKSRVGWPSDLCRIAIQLIHKWPSVNSPIAIHRPSDGHRTGERCFSCFTPFEKPLFPAYY